MRFPLSLSSILILAACTQSANPPTPASASTHLDITLPLTKEKAYDRMYRSFIEEGLNIASASAAGGSLTTVPLPVGASYSRTSDPIMEPYSRKITYRGIVLAQHDTVTIILFGTVRNANFGGPETKEEPLHSQMRGALHEAWHRLERIAANLRGEAPH